MSYLQMILFFWQSLFQHDATALSKVDVKSVELLQGTCIRFSQADKEHLLQLSTDGKRFHSSQKPFSDVSGENSPLGYPDPNFIYLLRGSKIDRLLPKGSEASTSSGYSRKREDITRGLLFDI